MTNLTTRTTSSGIGVTAKGSPLTNSELDLNFISLNNNKLEKNSSITVTTISAAGAISSTNVYVSGAITSLTTISAGTQVSSETLYVGGAVSAVGILYAATTSLLAIGGGLVGIGTTSPAAKLDVRTTAGTAAQMILYSGDATTVSKFNVGQVGSVDWDIGLAVTTGNFQIGGLGGGVPTAYSITRSGLSVITHAWNTAGSERMRIDTSGNVGIGGTSPTEKLTVVGNVRGEIVYGNRANAAAVTAGGLGVGIDGNVQAQIVSPSSSAMAMYTGGTERMRIDSSGNVGIGTTSPGATLNVIGTILQGNATNVAVANPVTGLALSPSFEIVGTSALTTPSFVRQDTSDSPQAMIFAKSRGSVASPTVVASADVIGRISFQGYDGANFIRAATIDATVDGTPGTTDMPGRLTFSTTADGASSPTERMRIDSAGNVSIGTSTTSTYKLQVAGSFAATTKSFLIPHPTRPGLQLQHGSLEGPENGVYVRGRLTNSLVIDLPDYWTGLIDTASITVNLTAVGKYQQLYVDRIENNRVYIAGDQSPDCFYTIWAERKDVAKLKVEI